MALLRAVGHVLQKVDGENPDQRDVNNAAYRSWTSRQSRHAVFREFIEEERNYMLKQYRLNVVDSAEEYVAVAAGDFDVGYVPEETRFLLDENLFRPVTGGFGAGQDARDIYREALEWWDVELSRTEEALNSREQ